MKEQEDREKQARILQEAGAYLEKFRRLKGVSLADVAKELSISRTYLSEIENGRRLPSDKIIYDLSDYFAIPEMDLFNKFGKSPLSARDLLLSSPKLQRTLTEIKRNKNLTDDDRDRLYDNIIKLYKDFTNGGH